MDLGMYLEMRMIGAYESLWDDITKQFTHYSSPLLVRRAVATIKHMLDTPALANANAKKILELEEELGAALRDAVGVGEIETAVLQEEEVKRFEGVALRVACLSSTRDMMTWMEDDEGGKQSRALDIFLALLERAKLGNEAEDKVCIAWCGRLDKEAHSPLAERTCDQCRLVLPAMEVTCGLCHCGRGLP
jgi:cohesin complex subunit SA-1/2